MVIKKACGGKAAGTVSEGNQRGESPLGRNNERET
jgi:hypothetical protein